ncbi:MAG: 2-oxoglutarate dehydrogenase complex dihydrolipoyllysine-residue succinyltransferase [Azospirillaceae bacterium]
MSIEITVPTLGESVTEATVAQWLKKEGDAVAKDEPVVELETDKVTLEVNASEAGTLTEIKVPEGETVEVGTLLAIIGEGGGKAAQKPAKPDAKAQKEEAPAAKETKSEPAKPEPAKSEPAEDKGEAGDIALPAAAKLMREHGLEAGDVQGTGKGGRITKENVLKAIDAGGAHASSSGGSQSEGTTIDIPAFERPSSEPRPRKELEERVRMSKLRQTIAKRLKEAQNTAAMLTTFNEVDMSALIALRTEYKDAFEKKHGVRLGFMGFFVKACVAALKELPAVNAEIDGTELVYKNYYDIGIAVSSPSGLVVPVLRDADTRSLAEVEDGISGLGRKARDGKLAMADLTGGTFTITNGGVFGSLMSTPILNPPQSGILAMHKIQERPMAVGGKVEIRPMMYLALSYDHRVIVGREAVTFLVKVKEAIEDPHRLLLGV